MQDPNRPDEPQGSHRMPAGDWFPEFSQEEKEPKPTTPKLADVVEHKQGHPVLGVQWMQALEDLDAVKAKLAAARVAFDRLQALPVKYLREKGYNYRPAEMQEEDWARIALGKALADDTKENAALIRTGDQIAALKQSRDDWRRVAGDRGIQNGGKIAKIGQLERKLSAALEAYNLLSVADSPDAYDDAMRELGAVFADDTKEGPRSLPDIVAAATDDPLATVPPAQLRIELLQRERDDYRDAVTGLEIRACAAEHKLAAAREAWQSIKLYSSSNAPLAESNAWDAFNATLAETGALDTLDAALADDTKDPSAAKRIREPESEVEALKRDIEELKEDNSRCANTVLETDNENHELSTKLAAAREALEAARIILSNESHGGILKQMANRDGRWEWYDKAKEARTKVEAALADDTKEPAT